MTKKTVFYVHFIVNCHSDFKWSN